MNTDISVYIIFAIVVILQLLLICLFGWTFIILIKGIKAWKTKGRTIPARVSARKLHFTFIICAHNEERVIRNPLESLAKLNYPRHLWNAYLIADNCSDKTAEIAASYPFVTILERTTREPSTKGKALRWGIEELKKLGVDRDNIYIPLDADNRVIPEFLDYMEEKFLDGAEVVNAHRVGSNPYQSLISGWYAIYWAMTMFFFCWPRHYIGYSATISGSGFGFKPSVLGEEGYCVSTITEDIELAAMLNIRGIRVKYAQDAIYYDEQPTRLGQLIPQLHRWATGGWQVLKKYTPKFLIQMKEKPSAFIYDCMVTPFMTPAISLSVILTVLSWVLTFMHSGGISILAFAMTVFIYAGTIVVGYAASRYSGHDPNRMIPAIIFYPIFLQIFALISLIAFFKPQKVWTKIEHYGLQDEAV